MTTELLVLQFVDDGKLSVEDAVQLLETLGQEEFVEPDSCLARSDAPSSSITLFILQEN